MVLPYSMVAGGRWPVAYWRCEITVNEGSPRAAGRGVVYHVCIGAYIRWCLIHMVLFSSPPDLKAALLLASKRAMSQPSSLMSGSVILGVSCPHTYAKVVMRRACSGTFS